MKNQSCTERNVQIKRNSSEETLIIKIEIGSVVLLFWNTCCLEYYFCGILDAAQPDPDSTSSGPQLS